MAQILKPTIAILAFSLSIATAAPEGLKVSEFSPSTLANEDGAPLFKMLKPAESGITLSIPIDTNHPLKRVYHSSSACGGSAIGDVDLDGVMDIFAANGPRPNALYLQTGNLTFTDHALDLGVDGGENWAVGSTFVDIDSDGDLDIFIANYDAPNQLFINQIKESGKLAFKETAATVGLDTIDGSIQGTFCDYDRDGDLDMYLLTHQIYRENGRPAEGIALVEEPNGKLEVAEEWRRWYRVDQMETKEKGKPLYHERGRPDRLFRNDNGKFVDVTSVAGIDTEPRWGNSATWWDYNNDGWPDIYTGNDFNDPDFLYRNNGDGTFSEVAERTVRASTWFSMGATQTDLNNDGLIDFVIADMMPSTHYMQKASMASMGSRIKRILQEPGPYQLMHNGVYINTDTEYTLEAAYLTGVAQTEWTWAIRGADFDADGWADLFFCNGIPRQFNHSDIAPSFNHEMLVGKSKWDYYESSPERREQNLVFQNQGGLKFEDRSKEWGLDHLGMSYGATLGDLNGDGWLDLVVTNLEDPLSVYVNRGTSGSHRIIVDLVGTSSNRDGLGARIEVKTASGIQAQQLFVSGGYLDGDESIAYFGTGAEENIESLSVHWPSGKSQTFADLIVDRRYTITEPEGEATIKPAQEYKTLSDPMFTESSALKGFSQKEIEFDDYERQSLLPFGLSQLGPGQAWGDIDNDGDADLFLGGAKGATGRIFLNQTEPGSEGADLVPVPMPALIADAGYEDMGCLFFDADKDGDLDLYVASGSIECQPGDKILQDRLYMNDGTGSFSRAPMNALPSFLESSSVVAGADPDRDGDIDLFVGSRSVPGSYPETPNSIFLQNNGDGTFTDATEVICPKTLLPPSSGLRRTGLVTSAVWSDYDGDNWIDLLVAHDWGGIKVYRNNGGKLVDQTVAAGLEKELGWWNGITAGDIDNDGDMDYVATNYGTNTFYKASPLKPELMFYGDFENNGKRHIIEANFEGETCFPRRGFSCSSNAMPYIRERMKTYHNFAAAPLGQIYDVESLSKSLLLRANTLETSLYRNNGNGTFEISRLPLLAQISPGYGVELKDVDLDGVIDCYLVQNFYKPQVETGPFKSGLSVLLKGTGDEEEPFTVVWPADSGLIVPGDAKSLSAVDLNLDGWVDFAVGVNNGDPSVFLNAKNSEVKNQPFRVRLNGSLGTASAIGAKITLKVPGQPDQTREITGGGSYLSQTAPDPIFALTPDRAEGAIFVEVRWPDGGVSEIEADPNSRLLDIQTDVAVLAR